MMRPARLLVTRLYRPTPGFTLVELVLVIALIAAIAALALPGATTAGQARLDAAAGEVAQAIRFAQSESIRTGAARVVSFDPATSHVRVFGLNMTATPPAEDTAAPVFYPVSRQQKYDFGLNDLPATAGVTIAGTQFTFIDGSTAVQLGFDATGAPVNILGSTASANKALTGAGQVEIGFGALRKLVYVDADTGRVTLSS